MFCCRNINESVKLNDMRNILKEKFQVTQDLPGVFFDPFAQMDNDLERKAVEKHTSALWNFAMEKADFEMKSIQDVVNDLYVCQKQSKNLASKNVNSLKTYLHNVNYYLFRYFFQGQLVTENSNLKHNASVLTDTNEDLQHKMVIYLL